MIVSLMTVTSACNCPLGLSLSYGFLLPSDLHVLFIKLIISNYDDDVNDDDDSDDCESDDGYMFM